MYNFEEIYEFWIDNRKYWIPLNEKDKLYIDSQINELFFIDNELSNKSISITSFKEHLGYIIYLDQFSRNMSRINNIIFNEDMIKENRLKAIDFLDIHLESYGLLHAYHAIIFLMPYKHMKMYKTIFKYIYKFSYFYLFDNKDFNNFYCDTYTKYMTDCIKIKTIKSKLYDIKINTDVCDFYTKDIKNSKNMDENENIDLINMNKDKIFYNLKRTILNNLKDIKLNSFTISLSGGVDSMVITYILYIFNKFNKFKENYIDFNVFHIIYGNRKESMDEFRIIMEFCEILNLPLYYYKIKYFERKYIEREKYELITRNIRFNCYSKLGGNIILGHIKDDVIENIWTNFATGKNLDNLDGMKIYSYMYNCNIYRPLLYTKKEDIYHISKTYGISYLCNTTPEWSNRGKFRKTLYPILKEHYKLDEDKTIEISREIETLSKIAIIYLYNPIIEDFLKYNKFIIKFEDIKLLNNNGWKFIFNNSFNKFNKNYNFCYSSINNFIMRLNNITEYKQEIIMNKKVKFNIKLKMGKIIIKVN